MLLMKDMATPKIMAMFGHSRIAEALKLRCATAISGFGGNEVEEALSRERGVGVLQTVAGEIVEAIAMHFPPKLLDLLRKDSRSNWPLAAFAKINLEKAGSSEAFLVQLQLANGVVNTKSTAGKLIDQWEIVNDLLEPLRRYSSLVLVFDAMYGQALTGLQE